MPNCKACGKSFFTLFGGATLTADGLYFCGHCWPSKRLDEFREITAHLIETGLEPIFTIPGLKTLSFGSGVGGTRATYGILVLCRSAVCFIPSASILDRGAGYGLLGPFGLLQGWILWLASGGLKARRKAKDDAGADLTVASIRETLLKDPNSLVFPKESIRAIRYRTWGKGLRLTTHEGQKVLFLKCLKCSRATYKRRKQNLRLWLTQGKAQGKAGAETQRKA